MIEKVSKKLDQEQKYPIKKHCTPYSIYCLINLFFYKIKNHININKNIFMFLLFFQKVKSNIYK